MRKCPHFEPNVLQHCTQVVPNGCKTGYRRNESWHLYSPCYIMLQKSEVKSDKRVVEVGCGIRFSVFDTQSIKIGMGNLNQIRLSIRVHEETIFTISTWSVDNLRFWRLR